MSFAKHMKLLAFLLPCLFSPIDAGILTRIGKNDKEKLNNIVRGKLALPSDFRVFVKYKNKRGRRLCKKLAGKHSFDAYLPKRNIVAIHVENRIALKRIIRNKNIDYVEPVHWQRALPIRKSEQKNLGKESGRNLAETVGYGISMIQADELQQLPPGKKMKICIVDSGYAFGHPDLPTVNITGSSTSTGKWNVDEYGHGTHVSGIIGAIGNDEGVAGVLNDPSRFEFHIAKSLDENGLGTEADFLDAFESCVDAGSKVISMSLGGDDTSTTIEQACEDAYNSGILLVGAAGNDGSSQYNYPASYPFVMSVAAVDQNRKVAGFSQSNDQVEIAGPGVDIVSTITNRGRGKQFKFGYGTWSGTSMATPYVAGVAAAVWSYFPSCTNNQIRNVLIRTARNDAGRCTEEAGFGIVQAKRAYDLLKEIGCSAGDAPSNPLSQDAQGGCLQDPSYVTPPTVAPTEFICNDQTFVLELTTDDFGDETTWELFSSSGLVGLGDSYKSNELHVEKLCLPPDEYRFVLKDSESDGICCRFGTGKFVVYYNGVQVKSGGEFLSKDIVTFGKPNQSNTATPTAAPTDRPTHSLTEFPSRSPSNQPPTLPPSSLPNKTPSGHPTSSPTKRPMPPPTNEPSNKPTALPSRLPTAKPSIPPSESPTPSPTSNPTKGPSRSPTASPTLNPTNQPTIRPTTIPTLTPTSPIRAPPKETNTTTQPISDTTENPTPTPTNRPLLHPTGYPTLQPTHSPTLAPSPLPSTQATALPTPSPTKRPSTPPTTPIPTTPSTNCQDDKDWFAQAWLSRRDCKYLREKPSYCSNVGKNAAGQTQSGYVACPIACNSCPVPTFVEPAFCNNGYGKGIHVCSEDLTKEECTAFVKLNGESCNDYCEKQGGYCTSAKNNAGGLATCTFDGLSSCSDNVQNNICSCAFSESPPLQQPMPSCTNPYWSLESLLCEQSELECTVYVKFLTKNSCNDYCKHQGGTCIRAQEDGHQDRCQGVGTAQCSDKAAKTICTCSFGAA